MKKRFLLLCLLAGTTACRKDTDTARQLDIRWDAGVLLTRSASPDEERISDLNLFVFSEDGGLEDHLFLDARTLARTGSSCRISLPQGLPYSLYACVNFGYRIPGISRRDDLLAYRYHMAYPDEYSRGIPMSGVAEIDGETTFVTIPLERMMSKVSVRIDRRALAEDVRFSVRSMILCNAPRSAAAFGPSKAAGSLDVFSRGFERAGVQADDLNREIAAGISREVSVYMLENLQGETPQQPTYLEMAIEYQSGAYHSKPGEYLLYRFYLSDGDGVCDVQRNFHYRYTVRPEGNGLLTEDNWRVDRTGLAAYGPATLTLHPAEYIEGMPGEEIHVWAEVNPPDGWFDIGREELEEDRIRGIYDYRIDEDGHGVRLTLRNPGTGIVYFEAGRPVSDAAMAVIVVNHETER